MFGAILDTFHTENTFRTVLPLSGIIRNIHFHWAHLFAYAAGYTFIFITLNAKQGKIAHRFQKYSDRAYIFAKCAIVLKHISEYDPDSIIQNIPYYKRPEHNLLDFSDMRKEEC